jgi:hypothetical protein
MSRKAKARKCRSQIHKDANDNGSITEEPCEMETLTHGSEAEWRR